MGATAVPGIDPAWLARLARADPVRHAWAVWDLERYPDRVACYTLVEDARPTAYLLVWLGALPLYVAHWVGPSREAGPLLAVFPRPPVVASVPLEHADLVARARGIVPSVMQLRAFDPERGAPPEVEGRARPLVASDAAALHAFGRAVDERIFTSYRDADPVADRVFGAFHDGRLAAAARVQVALDKVWLIGGVGTLPGYRNLGLATDVTRLIVQRALSVGARPALYVLEANPVAVRLYERLGFVLLERRGWIDAPLPSSGPR